MKLHGFTKEELLFLRSVSLASVALTIAATLTLISIGDDRSSFAYALSASTLAAATPFFAGCALMMHSAGDRHVEDRTIQIVFFSVFAFGVVFGCTGLVCIFALASNGAVVAFGAATAAVAIPVFYVLRRLKKANVDV